MLDTVLTFLTAELQAYLARRSAANGGDVGHVEPRRLVNDNGSWAIAEGQIGATLINVEEERVLKPQQPQTSYVGGRLVVHKAPLKLNLLIVFAANFQHYPTALRYLSLVLTFFQAHSTFAPEDFPALDPQIDRLSVELQSLSFEQLNQLWAFIGGKHLPSVVYKVRVVSLQDVEAASSGPPITTIATEVHAR